MLKRLFKKLSLSKKSTNKKIYKTAAEVSFVDLAGKEVFLEIRVNGNSTILVIKDKKEETEFMLDSELATLLGVLLQSYISHEVFPDLDQE